MVRKSREFLDDLRGKFSNCTTKGCSKRGCTLALTSIGPNRVIIDTDKCSRSVASHERLCDYLIFYLEGGDLITAVLELKSGRLDAKRAVTQISNGAKLLEQIVGACHVRDFFPVILHGRHAHRRDVTLIQARRIRFKSHNYRSIMKSCGVNFAEILKEFC